MKLFQRKTLPAPTFAERLEQADLLGARALSVFQRAAEDLDRVAAEHSSVVEDVTLEIEKLVAAHDRADDAAYAARSQAAKIRSLFD